MGLNFVDDGEGVGSLFGDNPVTVTGYRSPESGQLETLKYYYGTGSGYNTVYTVTEGKTFNITHIIISNSGVSTNKFKIAMNILENLWGVIFLGAIGTAFLYRAYSFWDDNGVFSFCMGAMGLIFLAYAIGLFLWPTLCSIFDSFRKK